MTYTVRWMDDALDELDGVWLDAADRDSVWGASSRIDRRLATDPLNEGESRTGGRRITFEAPLQVLFRVFETDRLVEVISVAASGRR
jgi:hypothetical protein